MSKRCAVTITNAWPVHGGFSAVFESDADSTYSGHVYAPQGIVSIEAQKPLYLSLTIVVGGTMYRRTIEPCPSLRYAVTLAKRLAKEMSQVSTYERLE